MFSYILAVLLGIAVVVADQISKSYIVANFEYCVSYPFLPKLVDITYILNGGGAWSMLDGYTWVLLSLTIIIMLICVALIIKVGVENKLMFWAMCLVLGGGIGNMIDRIFNGGKVVDFLHFTFWPDFPVFNVADIAIVIGALLLIAYFIKSTIDDTRAKNVASVPSGKDDADN